MNNIKYTLLMALFWQLLLPNVQAQLYINECLAINNEIIADEFGEFDDWIELYNAGNTDVDLANYYISDAPGNPTKWQIPATNATQTTVPAGGFLLLWADKDLDQGAHHLNLKLSSNGENLQLFAPDGTTLIDEVQFGEQNADVSFGRSNDGGTDFQTFPSPSPNISNTTGGIPTYTGIIQVNINNNSDDAEELPDGTVKLTSGDLEMSVDGTLQQIVGLRFSDIEIPQEAVIEKAQIQFTSFQTSTGSSALTIHAEASNDAPEFEATNGNISTRTVTAAEATWTPEDWTISDQSGANQKTTDLTAVVQEVIDRSGWQKGNAIAFFITGEGTRTAFAHDITPDRAAQLTIEVNFPAPSDPVQGLYINELASNGTDLIDDFGEQEDWIELYNANNDPVNIGGLFLTDNLDNPTKWQIASSKIIAPNGFAVLWADGDPEQGGLHSTFKLGTSGETLALVQVIDNAISILDSISFGKLPLQTSYGRTNDGASDWVTFSAYTPEASNDGSVQWLSPPTFSIEGGNYTSPQNLTLSHPDGGVQIRYTTDGSEPKTNSTLYNNSISITEHQGIKARAFKGAAISPSATQSFLIGANTNMPSLFINTEADNFFDDEIGIYVEGTNGVTEYCNTTPKNWAQEWERPVHISLFETDGSQAFGVNAGVQIGGACSRNFVMKSLNFYLRKDIYGNADLDYSLFPEREYINYTRFKLRNSGQDFVRMGFRDGLVQKILWDQVDLDLQAFRPTTVFLNGEFFGIHNLRENFNDEYFKDIYDVNKSDLDLLKSPSLEWQEIKNGTDEEYVALFNFIDNHDLSLAENYDTVSNQIDINEFLNYWISMIYTANYDWPANNVIVWKERKNNKKWRWALLDTDGSTNNGLSEQADVAFNTLAQVTDETSIVWPNHRNSTLFLRKLFENENFRDEFIQRSCSFMELIFNEERVIPLTDEVKDLYETEIQNHLDKWESGNALGGDYWSWIGWVDAFKTFFVERPDYYRSFVNQHFSLSGTYQLTVGYDENTPGAVFVNSNEMAIPFDYQGQYFKNVPLQLTAVANQGYEFSHWLETGATNPVIQFVADENATITPIFIENSINVSLGDDLTICSGSSVSVEAVTTNCTDCIYEWNDGFEENSRTLNPLASTLYSITITDASGITATDQLSITVNELPVIDATLQAISCNSAADGAINLNISGSGGNFSYLWSNNSTSSNINNLDIGNYSVTVTDGNTCKSEANFNLTEPPALNLLLETLVDVSCFNGNDGSISIDLSQGTAPFQIVWSHAANGSTINNLTANNYTVTITEANNCQTIDNFSIDQPTAIVANGNGSTTSCFDSQDGTINLMVDGGIAPYEFLWDNGAETQNLQQVAAGNYQVTITDQNNCKIIESFDVHQTKAIVANAIDSPTSCFGASDGAINITVDGGTAPYEFLWDNQVNTQNLQQVAVGDYQLTITDANNCNFVLDATVETPEALIPILDITSLSCSGTNDAAIDLTVNGGTAPFTYQWDNGATTQDLINLFPGTYSVTITDANECQQEDSATIGDVGALQPEVIINSISCHGASDGALSATVSGGVEPYIYSWSNNSTSSNINGLSAGVYILTITDVNNCQSISTFDLEEPALLVGLAQENAVSCFGANDGAIDVSVLGGTAPFDYQWSNQAASQNLSNLEPGLYDLSITDSQGCLTVIETVEIAEPLLLNLSIVDVLPPINGNDGSIEVSAMGGVAPYVFDWNNNQSGPLLTGLETGNYIVTVTDSNGCTQEESVLLETTATNNLATLNRFAIYPNPNNGWFHIDLQFTVFTNVDIRAYNVLGKTIFQQNKSGQQLNIPMNLNQQPAGIYLVEIQTLEGRKVQKVMVQP